MAEIVLYFQLLCTVTEFGLMDDDIRKRIVWYTPSFFKEKGFNTFFSWAFVSIISIISPFIACIKIIKWLLEKIEE